MIEIGRENQFMHFAHEGMQACATAKDGDVVRFHTQDCYGDLLTREDITRAQIGARAPKFNPTTGPVYIEGAHEGDTLAVEILDIVPGARGTMRLRPGVGAYGDRIEREHVRIFPIAPDGSIDFDGLRLELVPMIGVIGVAPKAGAFDTDTPHQHGGNMDNRCIGKGCTMYFPVGAEGAYLGLGDVHGLMGDGEVCICGLEMAATVDVRVRVIHGRQEGCPIWEKDGLWAAMYSAKTLDEAARGARYALLDFLEPRVQMGKEELILLLSLIGDLAVCQVVDPLQTVRFSLRRPVGEIRF
jgi:amidase